MHAQTPVQIAWVTTDLDATEDGPDHAVGRQEVGPRARRALRPRHVHLPRAARRLRRAHLVQLRRRHPARADRPGAGRERLHRVPRPGGPGLHHICVEVDDVDDARSATRATVRRSAGVMPGGMEFAYVTAAGGRRALHRDRAHPARDPGVLRLRETGAAVVSTEIPETVDAADVTSWSDEVDVVVVGFGIAGGCAAVSAAAAGARVLVLEKAAAAGGTSVDGRRPLLPRRRHRRAAGDGPRRHRRGDVQVPGRGVAASRTTRRSAPTATAASSTSTGWRTWAFSSSAATTRARSSSRPAPRGCRTPATRRCGRSASRPSPRRAATRCRCPATWAAPRWSSTCWSSAPTSSACRSATRPARPTSSSTTVRWSASRWKHFTETGAIKAKSVVIAAGGFAMNPEMVAEHTPALGQKRRTKHHGVVEPYILGNPNDDGLGIRLGVSAGGVAKNLDQLFITAAAYPPEILLTGDHRQQGRASGSSPRTPTTRARRPSCWSSPTSRRTSSSTRRTCRCPRCR